MTLGGDGRGSRTLDQIAVGSSWSAVVIRNLTRGQIVQYAGASGDFNPLHTDEPYATQVAGYPSVFAHGMLTMALTGTAITDLFGAGSMTRFGGRFRAQVWPDDTLTVDVRVVDLEPGDALASLEVTTTNQNQIVVFQGTATVTIGAPNKV
ncbi:MAG: putative dehydrogenase [Subtercola sp.]|nr:putative dehydrogenase [Subtercola sp.]